MPCALLGAMGRRVNKTKTSIAMELHSSEKHKLKKKKPRKMWNIKTVCLTIKTMGMKILFTNMTNIQEDFKSSLLE